MAETPTPGTAPADEPGATAAAAGSAASSSDGSADAAAAGQAALTAAQPGGGVGEVTAKPYESLIPKRGPVAGALAPVAGFGVTIKNFFSPTVTEQYPRERVPTKPRYHGRHQLNRYADGLEKCIGCELCAWACPADAIYVEAGDNTPDEQFSPGERYGRVYQINYLRCIFCGLCIEACPTRALTMTNEYELAGHTRPNMIWEKQDLLAPLREGMLAAPHPMVEGTSDTEYYRGEVTTSTDAQRAWLEQHRPDDPSLRGDLEAARPHGATREEQARITAAARRQGGAR